jgi:hypothetical protein
MTIKTASTGAIAKLLLLCYSLRYGCLCFHADGFSRLHHRKRAGSHRLSLPATSSAGITTTGSLPQRERQQPTNTTIIVPQYSFDKVADSDGTSYHCSYPSPLHKIHIRSILNENEAAVCLQLATNYASTTGCWDQPDFDRHASYATCDFAVEECESMDAYLEEIDFTDRMFDLFSELYGIPVDALSWLDLFCAHYQAKSQDHPLVIDRLEEHRDGSLLSFALLLNSAEDFEGGGTYFDALRDVTNHTSGLLNRGVIRLRRSGDASLHCGKLLHGADAVTKGIRTVLVGFVQVSERFQRRGILSRACRDFGRMDVAAKRYKRQQMKTSAGSNGWFLNNKRWLPKGSELVGQGAIQAFCPALSSVVRRAEPEYQRRMKLQAEDILLRSILLAEAERQQDDSLPEGITIL